MAAPDFIDNLVDSLTQQTTQLLKGPNLPAELEENVRALLQGALHKMDVVPRDEFEAQLAVLQRTRAKLEALESELEALRQSLQQ